MRASCLLWGLFLALALPGLGACDGSPAEMPAATDGGAQAGGVAGVIAAAIAQATCEKVDLCCPGEERMRVLGVGDDRAACETNFGAFYGRQYGAVVAEIAAERTRFDATQLAACLDGYRAAGCQAPGMVSAMACALVLKGTLPDGGSCETGLNCESRECVRRDDGDRQCQPRKANGQTCRRDSECASGLCSTSFLSGTCSSMVPPGDRCGGDGFWLLI